MNSRPVPGLIPAHAGSTRWRFLWCRMARAHPRSRGEHFSFLSGLAGPRGSSPLTRGARDDPGVVGDRVGLIPAHAGSTPARRTPKQSRTAHPRSRGEHSTIKCLGEYNPGSSPLTRGAPQRSYPARRFRGLIPAHAGSTISVVKLCQFAGAHPRSRGEHFLDLFLIPCPAGSSPLTRGALASCTCSSGVVGLIPAHAGSTTAPSPRLHSPRAHPRSRGEHDAPPATGGGDWGSSPLTRGARLECCTLTRGPGLIPAHAGSTLVRPWTRWARSAHPRSRGEHDNPDLKHHRFQGSSPLTRGALH